MCLKRPVDVDSIFILTSFHCYDYRLIILYNFKKNEKLNEGEAAMGVSEQFSFSIRTKIYFGCGSISKLKEIIIDEYQSSGLMIVTDENIKTAGLIDKVSSSLPTDKIRFFFDQVMSDPETDIIDEGAAIAKEHKIDAILAIGGGSVIDAAKAISFMAKNDGSVKDYWFGGKAFTAHKVPLFAVPTTSGTGSEITKAAMLTDPDTKFKGAGVSPVFIPEAAFADPEMTMSMPAKITASTGMDALTHAVECFTNYCYNPISDVLAAEAIRLIGQSLRVAVAKGDNIMAREKMLLGSIYAAAAFDNGMVGIVHALAHPLGGHFNVPHGIGNAILLPKVMEFNLMGNYGKYARIAQLLGENIDGLSDRQAALLSVDAVKNLLKDIGIPENFKSFNIPGQAIDRLIADALKNRNLLVNPRKSSVEDFRSLYERLI